VKVLGDTYFSVVYGSRTRAQIGTFEFITDYRRLPASSTPSSADASFLPNSPVNQNAAEFCDPRIDRQIERALTEQATNADAARALWERIDRQTVDQPPLVPLVNPKSADVLSKRTGNYQYSPACCGMLIDQLWVR
jgi:ABC-type transport system substrate-binding protein